MAHLFSLFTYPGCCRPQGVNKLLGAFHMQQTFIVVKYYKVLISPNSRWYKLILLIQRGKTFTIYVVKTQDRETLDTLTSSCKREVKDGVLKIVRLLLFNLPLHQISLAHNSGHIHLKSTHCKMRNYYPQSIL